MKRQFALGFTALSAAIVLSSAGLKSSRIEQLSQATAEAGEKLPAKQNFAFREGEHLSYRLHYGFINAGVAELEVKPEVLNINNRKVYHIVGTGFTTGTTDWFFKVRDRYETYMDKDALLPWLFVRRVDEGGYKFSQDYAFNHFTKKVDIGNNEKLDIPAGVQDMVSAFYAARNMNLGKLREGDIVSMQCFMDKELWPAKIRFIGRETIETDLGDIRCLKFRPIVQKGRVFKEEEDLTVWISDDNNHIPVRAQADILVGSIKMDLAKVKNLNSPLAMVK